MKLFLHSVLTSLSILLSFGASAQQGSYTGTEPNVALRIRVNGAIVLGEADLIKMSFAEDASATAEFKKHIIKIKPGASVQLKVEMIDAKGHITDVTTNAATEYQSMSPWRLTVSDKGLVSVTPSAGSFPRLGRPDGVGDASVVVVFNTSKQGGWNKVFFNKVP